MDGFDLVVLGDCNADLIVRGDDVVPRFGQHEHLVDEASLTIGGSGGICASGAARLGLRVAMVGVVGDDEFGRFTRDALTRRGVDVSQVSVDPQVPTGLSIHLDHHGDRAILTLPGTIPRLTAELVDPSVLAASRWVHVSSYFLLAGLWHGLPQILQQARAEGAGTSLDPNWDPSGAWDGGLSDVLPHLNLLLPNEAEAIALARTVGAAEDGTVESATRVLAATGPTVVAKLGARGALAATPAGDMSRMPALQGVSSVDAVGAGDSFDGGLLAGLLWGHDLGQALALATACGGLSTRSAGGVEAQPAREEATVAAHRLPPAAGA